MILADTHDRMAVWRYAERYLGGGTRTYSRFAGDLEISSARHPQFGDPSFLLPTFVVPHDQGQYVPGVVESKLHRIYRDDGAFLLPVHPDALASSALTGRDELARCEAGPPIEVVPSGNGRTVFVERVDGAPVEPHFLKLHYPGRLSRFTRRLRRPMILLGLWVARELDRIGAPFLPEVAGAWFGHDPREAWGFIAREASPLGDLPAHLTVPLFALYGHDLHRPDDPSLLEQLVIRSGEPPEAFLGQRVVAPMVRLWAETLRATGCAIELHGQNTLFLFTPDARSTRVAYRDCGVYIDPQIRRELGLGDDLPEANVISRDILHPREQILSLVYDSFMGHHALAYLARLAWDRFRVPPRALQARGRAELEREPGIASLLPPTVYYYDSQLHPDGGWRLADTGGAPQWR